MKPWLKFFPGDWQRDSALRMCSLGARGLWLEMLCIMHQAEPYGHLVVNGRAVSIDNLARMVGCTAAECRRFLKELEGAGVFSTTQGGALYSRRMVKDAEVSEVRAACGKLGGNPSLKRADDDLHDPPDEPLNRLLKQKDKQEVNAPVNRGENTQKSDVRSQKNPPNPPPGLVEQISLVDPPQPRPVPVRSSGFDAFWDAWPAHFRKADKLACLRRWDADECEDRASEIRGCVEAWKASEQWQVEGGKYIPAPLVWLKQRRYEAPPPKDSGLPPGAEIRHGQVRLAGGFVP